MKTSNKLLLGFLATIIGIMVFIAFQLKAEYKKINLNDKYRNYDRIALSSVKFLAIEGPVNNEDYGDADDFSIKCIVANEKALLLPKNDFFRKHISYVYRGDTLLIHSTLPYPYDLDIFLLGVFPQVIKANCARINIDSLKLTDMQLNLEQRAMVSISQTQLSQIIAKLSGKAQLSINKNTAVNDLSLTLQQQSELNLGLVKLAKVSLQMSDSAKITATKANLFLLQKSVAL
ncbi:hypothetical protein [Emticicia sp. 17c]|uniref:hypothetical protein n=1 Tax=Emticicia sp. 17c TaxID=3127704 RepID=UPI00301B78AB